MLGLHSRPAAGGHPAGKGGVNSEEAFGRAMVFHAFVYFGDYQVCYRSFHTVRDSRFGGHNTTLSSCSQLCGSPPLHLWVSGPWYRGPAFLVTPAVQAYIDGHIAAQPCEIWGLGRLRMVCQNREWHKLEALLLLAGGPGPAGRNSNG